MPIETASGTTQCPECFVDVTLDKVMQARSAVSTARERSDVGALGAAETRKQQRGRAGLEVAAIELCCNLHGQRAAAQRLRPRLQRPRLQRHPHPRAKSARMPTSRRCPWAEPRGHRMTPNRCGEEPQ